MPQIFYFMLKVILCSGILFGYYHLFLRNKVYHAYNRYYLLCAVILSLAVPLFQFDIYNSKDETQLQPIQILEVLNNSDAYIEEVITTGHTQNIELSDLLFAGYIAVSFVFLVSFFMLLFRVISLIRKSDKNSFNNIILINSNAKGTPFSFFRYLFWNNQIDINTETGKHIFSHELAHIREKHSLDKIFLNVVLIFCWINPFFWLIRKELNMIHEFIADKKAVGQYDTAVLASMIIQTAYPTHNFLITNHFFYSPIKRRLKMLSKYKSTRTTYFTRILVLPVLLMLIAAFTFKAKKGFEPKINKEYIVVIDAGHGGQDWGSKAVDGTQEKDLNLALAKMVKELNTNDNINIILTRENDVYQSPKEKAQVAINLKADLFISIHVSNTPKKYFDVTSGMEVYVARDSFQNSASSKTLASAVIGEFNKNYKLKINQNPIQRQMGIWVLQQTKCPAILIEAGYISHSNDRAYLKSQEGQETFAKNILSAINNYIMQPGNGLPSPVSVLNPQGKISVDRVLIRDTVPVRKSNKNILPSKFMWENAKDKSITRFEANEFITDEERNEKPAIVINNKIYSSLSLQNKNIIAQKVYSYGKNNKSMIEKYGSIAKNGILVFEDAVINDIVSEKYSTILKEQKANPNADASEWSFEPESNDRLSRGIINPAAGIKLKEIKINEKNRPLFILNGKEISEAEFAQLDIADDILSIDVIKGEHAIIKYGQKALNGVVIVHTKTEQLKKEEQSNAPSDDIIFLKVEVEPQFPGGQASLDNYLSKNSKTITSPEKGLRTGNFTATIRFIVNKDGSISDIKSTDYPSNETVQHYIELIKNGPKWIPGKQNNHVVKAIKILKIPLSVI
ncbi:MAG: N-acetylmuramoyl-L-alanine amidase [Ferruginibacter sp.]